MSTCETCKHYNPLTDEAGECRGKMPHPFMAQARNMINETVPMCLGAWPQIPKTGWCGQHTGHQVKLVQ